MIHQLIQQYRPEVSQEQVVALIRQRLSLIELLARLGLADQAPAISSALVECELHRPLIEQPEMYKGYRLCP